MARGYQLLINPLNNERLRRAHFIILFIIVSLILAYLVIYFAPHSGSASQDDAVADLESDNYSEDVDITDENANIDASKYNFTAWEEDDSKPTDPPRESIWDITLPRNVTDEEKFRPHLVFVKGLKVGGTSVAYALNRIADRYKIPLAHVHEGGNRIYDYAVNCKDIRRGSLYFHHGYKNAWSLNW